MLLTESRPPVDDLDNCCTGSVQNGAFPFLRRVHESSRCSLVTQLNTLIGSPSQGREDTFYELVREPLHDEFVD